MPLRERVSTFGLLLKDRVANTKRIDRRTTEGERELLIQQLVDSVRLELQAANYLDDLTTPDRNDVERNRMLCVSALNKWNSNFVFYEDMVSNRLGYEFNERIVPVPSQNAHRHSTMLFGQYMSVAEPESMVQKNIFNHVNGLFIQKTVREASDKINTFNSLSREDQETVKFNTIDRLYFSTYLPIAQGILKHYHYQATNLEKKDEEEERSNQQSKKILARTFRKAFRRE